MKFPRWLHKWYANFSGYFWLPCPLCGNFFGGHEWKIDNKGDAYILIDPDGSGKAVCPNCHERAKNYNIKWLASRSLNMRIF
jgi:hypothetical protein